MNPTHGWHRAGESLVRAANDAYTRATLLDALGHPANDAWAAWANVVAHALYVGSLAGTVHARSIIAKGEHESPTVESVIEPGTFREGLKRMEETAIADSVDIDLLFQRIKAGVTEYAEAERRGGASEIVARIRRWVSNVEQSFWVRGATPEQTANIRNVLIDAITSMGKIPPKGENRIYSDLISRVRGFAHMSADRADVIVRTNMMRSFNLAQVDRLERPEARRVIPLLILVEVQDPRTRGAPDGVYAGSRERNPGWHWQMDGLVGTIEQFREWNVIPPNGYRCRGGVRGLTLAECEEMGFLRDDGSIDFERVRRHNGIRLEIIGRGLYPDRGFKRAA